jgi:COP9 signalosome complex subunit 6
LRSRAADHLLAQHSAIKMLASRVRLVLEYVKAVESGELPHNHEIMRQVRDQSDLSNSDLLKILGLQVRALSHRLPVLEPGRFRPEFYTQVWSKKSDSS